MKRNYKPPGPIFNPDPVPLNIELKMNTKRKKSGWIDRHPLLSFVLIFGTIIAIGWWADIKLNPQAHSQSLSQGLHQLFH